MRDISSEERPVKRHKGCIKYYLQGPKENAGEDASNASDSPMQTVQQSSSFQQTVLPTRTPVAAGLLLPGHVAGTAPTGRTAAAGQRHLASCLLQSLQRRFVSQQTLDTPCAAGHEESQPEEDDLDGFVLHSQPTYERMLSQHVSQTEDLLLPSSLTDTHYNDNDAEQQPRRGGGGDNRSGLRVELPSEEEVGSQPLPPTSIGSGPLALIVPPEGHGLTPAVHSVDRVQLNSGGPAGHFPIFRSKRDCKVVYIVRHGESEFNAAMAAQGSKWEDPLIYDARLTLRGRQQASSLRKDVPGWKLPSNVVWITSPLSRAIETMMIMHPGACGVNAQDDPCGDSLAASLGTVCILPEIAERLVTSGDIGRRPADLAQQFPFLKEQLEGLPEVWWYSQSHKPNCPDQGLFGATETRAHMDTRIKTFRQWLLKRPEKVFVAVGHSVFWKAFATACNNGIKQETLRNCEWRVVHV